MACGNSLTNYRGHNPYEQARLLGGAVHTSFSPPPPLPSHPCIYHLSPTSSHVGLLYLSCSSLHCSGGCSNTLVVGFYFPPAHVWPPLLLCHSAASYYFLTLMEEGHACMAQHTSSSLCLSLWEAGGPGRSLSHCTNATTFSWEAGRVEGQEEGSALPALTSLPSWRRVLTVLPPACLPMCHSCIQQHTAYAAHTRKTTALILRLLDWTHGRI